MERLLLTPEEVAEMLGIAAPRSTNSCGLA
jgi:hypothetical protein